MATSSLRQGPQSPQLRNQTAQSPQNLMKALSRAQVNRFEERDFLVVVWHEAGHYIAAKHFNVAGGFYVRRMGDPTLTEKSWIGQATYLSTTTAFRTACIGWAGPLAEQLAFDPLAEMEVECVFDNFCQSPTEFSDSDRLSIEQHHQPWRTCRLAGKIIQQRYDALRQIVDAVIRERKGKLAGYGIDWKALKFDKYGKIKGLGLQDPNCPANKLLLRDFPRNSNQTVWSE